jgi:mRNA interferase MazF
VPPRGCGSPKKAFQVVQDDRFDATDSITVCPLTTTTADVPLL